jgi:hypothetical protein
MQMAVYRGWMLTPAQYRDLYEALTDRRVSLINTPEEYAYCHHLPLWYPALRDHTPASVWIPAGEGFSTACLRTALGPFGAAPVIVKDYVKSRKHEWHEACFIPSASDMQAVERVVGRFLERQGDDLNGGLVFRQFVPFEPLTTHSRSGMPLTREFRLFFLKGEPIHVTKYWGEGEYAGERPPLGHFQALAGCVQSRFFTMDVAKQLDGPWMVVELGDGQVAELPEHSDWVAFYEAVRGRVMPG